MLFVPLARAAPVEVRRLVGAQTDLAAGDWVAQIETQADLTRGNWEVVVVRHACDKCIAFSDALSGTREGYRRILVEMEPYASDAQPLVTHASADAYGRLPMTSNLPVDAAPLLVTISDDKTTWEGR